VFCKSRAMKRFVLKARRGNPSPRIAATAGLGARHFSFYNKAGPQERCSGAAGARQADWLAGGPNNE
jgi:hypothetical protein